MIFDGLGPGIGPTTSPESVDAALSHLVALGVSGTQLTANGWDVVLNGRVVERRLVRYRAVVERYRLSYTFHAPIAELNLAAPDDAFQRQQCRAWLEVAAALGCRTMTYHPGRFDPAMDPHSTAATRLAQEREHLASLAETAQSLGVVIACENLVTQAWWPAGKRHHSADPAWLVELVEGIGHPSVATCLDFGHLQLASVIERFDFAAAAARLAPYAVVLHVHDNFAKPMQPPEAVGGASPAMPVIRGEGDLHLPPGWGTVPLEAAFEAGRFTRRPIMVLEMESRYWRDDPDVVRESLAAGRRFSELVPPHS
ncbi:MAG TPA: sugar phosphate isomerase/epimerase family protein [Chloroflexota bacterium]|nr:sugar phosphate isomerase/epimerase family protein [Chloroflexota bacterium]